MGEGCEEKRWRQSRGCTQGTVQARAFGGGVVVPRHNQLHGASAAAHHIHGLRVHPRRCNSDTHGQRKPHQHEAGKSVGVAQGLQSHKSLGCVSLAYCLGLLAISPCWCPPMSAPPPGAVCATGTFNSILLSTPLASLNTKVSGIVVSFCKGSFRSMSMTW